MHRAARRAGPARAYAFPGGGADVDPGWRRSRSATCARSKARVALALGLGAGLDRAGLAALLADPEA